MDNIVPGYKPGNSGYSKDPNTILGETKSIRKNVELEKLQKDFDNELNKPITKRTNIPLGGKRKTKKMRNRRKMQKKHKKTNKK